MTRFFLYFLKPLSAPGSEETASRPLVTRFSQFVLGGSLMLACLMAFAPVYPGLPEAGLDPSWMLAMNQAVQQHFVFGRDIVFTYGPYSALLTQAYYPATYNWMLVLGMLLGFCYAAMLLMNLRQGVNSQLWLYTVFLFLIDSRDALFFSYPLLVVLTAAQSALPETNQRRLVFSPRTQIVYVFAVALLGLPPIIKASFLPLSVMAGLAGFILHWRSRERIVALQFIVLPMVTMIVLWQLAGQPITALLGFFPSISPIVSGFSEAMSSFPDKSWSVTKVGIPGMIAAYISVAALLLASIFRDRGKSTISTIVTFSWVGLFIFIVFKAGFIRHDQGHVPAASSTLALAALALNIFGIAKIPSRTLVLSFTIWVLIHLFYFGVSLSVSNSVNQSPIHNLLGIIKGDRMGGRIQEAFNQHLTKIKKQSPIQEMSGTSDIYPYDQAALIASGNNWVSRPVLQSYSAYTPTLASINEAYLRGPTAPDNIAFRIATIDVRLPSLDDGMSWPTLFSHYSISTSDQRYTYLKKRHEPLQSIKTIAMQGSYLLGNQVDLPQGEHIYFAEVDVSPTVLGQIAKIIYKPPPLFITVNLVDGQSKTYRFIPSMARTGFVISPLIRTTTDFVHLATSQLPLLATSKVASIRIAPEGTESMFWDREYSLRVFALETAPISTSKRVN